MTINSLSFYSDEYSNTDHGNGWTLLNILKTTEFYTLNRGLVWCIIYFNKAVEKKENTYGLGSRNKNNNKGRKI